MMKKLHAIPLVTAGSAQAFPELSLQGAVPDGGKKPKEWSVRTYTLRGGVQEGVQVIEVQNGMLSFAVLPTRGMSIWKGECGDVRLGWDSPVKDPVNPAFINEQDRGGLGWLKGFNEWFVRCGLNSMGAPGEDTVLDYSGNPYTVPLTLHGKIANVPARNVSIEVTDTAIHVYGEVDETMMFGPALRLNTRISTDLNTGAMEITDTVTNLGNNPVEHQMLYHINYGPPLLEEGSKMLTPFKQVSPRDPRSAEGIDHFDTYGPSEPGFVEQAYYYELAGTRGKKETMALLRNAAGNRASLLRFSLKDFPCFTLWKNTSGMADGYVTGLEPATAYPNVRRFEREKGRVITLDGGASRTTVMRIETLEGKKAVKAAEAEIAEIGKKAKATVHPEPLPKFSGS